MLTLVAPPLPSLLTQGSSFILDFVEEIGLLRGQWGDKELDRKRLYWC